MIQFTAITAPVAGQSTVEISAAGGHSDGFPLPPFKAEYLREDEAVIVAQLSALGYDHITAIYWVHSHNRFGCKPDVVANSCGLTVWKTAGKGLAPIAVDIFEGY